MIHLNYTPTRIFQNYCASDGADWLNFIKKMRLIAFIFITYAITNNTVLADSLSLEQCQSFARSAAPNFNEIDLVISKSQLTIRNISSGWLPRIDLNGQASYQSDVTGIDANFPPSMNIDFPTAPHEQFKIYLDVNQTIYDGGISKSRKQLELLSLQTELTDVEIQFQKIRENINRFYYSALILKAGIEISKATLKDLQNRERAIQSKVLNGVSLAMNLSLLQAEIIITKQRSIEFESDLDAVMKILSRFINKELSNTTELLLPQTINTVSDSIVRPELMLCTMQQNRLTATVKLLNAQRMPKLFAFAQAGYGKPGLNMLSDKFDNYYIIGAGLKWNLIDWHSNYRERQILNIQREILNQRKATAEQNIQIDLDNKKSEIRKYNELVKSDYELLQIRNGILRQADVQFENGSLTGSDFISEIYARNQAELNLRMHIIQQSQAIEAYRVALGDR